MMRHLLFLGVSLIAIGATIVLLMAVLYFKWWKPRQGEWGRCDEESQAQDCCSRLSFCCCWMWASSNEIPGARRRMRSLKGM
ncbi:membrane-associated protein, putative [Bodo saltans]|uniref:Membrane-associated protein, putative n=1 Tax=Bodo saltans TaxID=75058 RepID=A0A0S4J7D0_BODSA|nr:membrane-associated protein, putative [Bodo saltans]|eukprot:CUG86371.1 membrane-associated protein, putative [Bodo saltans]